MRNCFSPAVRFFPLAMLLFAAFVCFPFESWGQTFTFSTLYTFKNNGQDPVTPAGFLIVDSQGNLYGTSLAGGTFGLGTVFEITNKGKLSVLHSFQGSPNDGRGGQGLPAPSEGLARDSAGNLYGTTQQGGTSTACDVGCGVVFKLTPTGKETILYNFGAGAQPTNVILDSHGNLYGTTSFDGAYGSGTVYEISGGNFTVLYNFCHIAGCEDGAFPFSGLVRDSAGNLYGVTYSGGTANDGTIFKVTPSGVETVLHSFLGSPTDGMTPVSNLKQDTKGNLYGTTLNGGPDGGGVLFEQPENGGQETILYSFCPAGCTNADYPYGPVQIDKAGNFYGSASALTGNGSVIWEVTPAGEERILHTFAASAGGAGGLVIDSQGDLYGTTTGQSNVAGSVFKLTRK